jgi:hypothetical protein
MIDYIIVIAIVEIITLLICIWLDGRASDYKIPPGTY